MPDIDFDAAYQASTPPWDIGRPQSAIAKLIDARAVSGDVLDVGCGSGEHALLAAAHGLTSTGIDASAAAIELAREKARTRGLDVRFVVGDALRLEMLGSQYDTVIDSGLFHVFDDDRRREYVAGLASAVRAGGRLFLLCFSDRVPPLASGPRRISETEIRDAFTEGWDVNEIGATTFEVTGLPSSEFAAWLATITRR
jgi:SAM-dependent methyltransferase